MYEVQVNKFLEKHSKINKFFLIDLFLFLNIISFQLDTLDPTWLILQLFQAVRIIWFVQLKISFDELLSGDESHSSHSEPFLQVWKQEIVTGG